MKELKQEIQDSIDSIEWIWQNLLIEDKAVEDPDAFEKFLDELGDELVRRVKKFKGE